MAPLFCLFSYCDSSNRFSETQFENWWDSYCRNSVEEKGEKAVSLRACGRRMDIHHVVDNEFRAYLTRITDVLRKKQFEDEEGNSLCPLFPLL